MADRGLERLVNEAALSHLANVTVTVTPFGKAPHTANALYLRPYAESEIGAGYDPTIQGLTSELDPNSDVDEQTLIAFEGVTYRLANREPDGTGFETWQLELQ